MGCWGSLLLEMDGPIHSCLVSGLIDDVLVGILALGVALLLLRASGSASIYVVFKVGFGHQPLLLLLLYRRIHRKRAAGLLLAQGTLCRSLHRCPTNPFVTQEALSQPRDLLPEANSSLKAH